MKRMGAFLIKSVLPFTFTLVVGISTTLMGCESEEDNKIARAQACLDNRPKGTGDFSQCRDILGNASSPKAMAIRCVIAFLEGGLTTSKIAEALKAGEADSSQDKKEASFLGNLALNSTEAADEAVKLCNQSDVEGHKFFANTILIGTYLTQGGAVTDPAAFLQKCSDGECNDAAIGTAIINLSQSSCEKQSADEAVCKKIRQTIDKIGSNNPADVAQEFYDFLKGI